MPRAAMARSNIATNVATFENSMAIISYLDLTSLSAGRGSSRLRLDDAGFRNGRFLESWFHACRRTSSVDADRAIVVLTEHS